MNTFFIKKLYKHMVVWNIYWLKFRRRHCRSKKKIHWNDLLRAWLWMLYHVVGDFEPSLTRYCWNVIEILFFQIFYASHLLQRKHKDLVRLTSNLSSMEGHDTHITKFGDRNFPPQKFPPLCSPLVFPPGSFPPPHAKYAVDANLFR